MKEVSDEVDFLHVDQHESFVQIDIMNWMGIVKHSQSPQISKFALFLQNIKKDVRHEVGFLLVDNRQSFLQVDFNTLGIKVSYKVTLSLMMSMIKHFQSTQSNKFAISMQYPKNKLEMDFIFCM